MTLRLLGCFDLSNSTSTKLESEVLLFSIAYNMYMCVFSYCCDNKSLKFIISNLLPLTF